MDALSIIYMLLWWLGLTVLGWAAYGLFWSQFSILADKGYGITKVIGLVLLTYIVWLGGSVYLWRYSSLTIWILTLILLIGAGYRLWKVRPHLPIKLILAEEVLFAIATLGWSVVRSYNPRIEGVEKLMDIAILNNLLRTTHFPPIDTWFAGSSINYYYFGHLLVATLAKLTLIPAQYAFDLGLAGTFGLCTVVIFSLVYSLSHKWWPSLLSFLLLTVSCNLDPAIQAIKKTPNYIFFAATRLDRYTINEFPLYSFTVADLHAHVLGLPIALTLVTLFYVVLSSSKLNWLLLGIVGVLLGATGPTNSFDLVIYGGFLTIILCLRAYLSGNPQWRQRGLLQALGMGLLAGGLYLPFYLAFHAPVGGVGVSLFKTSLYFILVNFGILLFCSVPIVVNGWPRLLTIRRDQNQLQSELSIEGWFGLVLVVMGILLIIAPEFVYLKDIYNYQNPPYARANTIFKVYYQAWAVLSVAAGYGVYLIGQIKWKKWVGEGMVMILGALLALSSYGTYTAVKSYRDSKPSYQKAWTLDGYQYLTLENPDQLAMIHYLNSSVQGQPRILEAAGESYTKRSIVSAYTGLPTLLGWASHEWGWRYSPVEWPVIAGKEGLIEQIYKSADGNQLLNQLHQNQIQYVVVSDVEREQYAMAEFPVISTTLGQPVFQKNHYAVYKVPS